MCRIAGHRGEGFYRPDVPLFLFFHWTGHSACLRSRAARRLSFRRVPEELHLQLRASIEEHPPIERQGSSPEEKGTARQGKVLVGRAEFPPATPIGSNPIFLSSPLL